MSLFLIVLTATIVTFTGLVLCVLVQVDRTRRRHRARMQRGLDGPGPAAPKKPRRANRDTPDITGLTPRIEALLAQTGLRLTPTDICIQIAIAALAIYGLAVLYAGLNPLIALVLAVVLPVLLALAVLRHARARYQAAFTEGLPDALDIFARGLRAGRPIADSLRIVVETTTGPVQAEFARTHGEICLGTSLQDSLAALYQRLRTAELGFFAVATALQADSGGNLVETLENLAEQLRERRKLRKKARALSSEARASAMILAALPFCIALALFVLNGAYLQPLFTDPRGQVMAAGALTSVALGVFVMARMGRADVESTVDILSWMAFAGLILVAFGLGALVDTERRRAVLMLRLRRANGEALAPRSAAPGKARRSDALAGICSALRRVVLRMGERLSAILGGEARDTTADLRSAGYQGRDALLIYAFLKTVLPVGAFLSGGVWVVTVYPIGMPALIPSAIVLAVALGMSMGVDMVVDSRRRTRMGQIRRSFPDLLELLVIASEAGQGPQQALHRVSRELQCSAPELAAETRQLVAEIAMTNDRRTAYDKLRARVPLPEIAIFTQALDQSDTYGTPFARAMRNLVSEQRANRLIAMEEKAARLPVLMTIPLIFCIMPAVFVVLVGPAGLSIFDNILAGR